MGKYKDGNVRPEDAARELNMSVSNFRQHMIRGSFPISIGSACKGKKNYAFYVKREPLNKLKQMWGL